METLIELDKALFVYLNSLGSENYDLIWLFITDKKSTGVAAILLNKETEIQLFESALITFKDKSNSNYKNFKNLP